MQHRNFLLFLASAVLLFFIWAKAKQAFFPRPEPARQQEVAKNDQDKAEAPREEGKKEEDKGPAKKAEPPQQAPEQAVKLPEPPPETDTKQLIALGSPDRSSPFHLEVVLDPLGAGVRTVALNKFQQADQWGKKPLDQPLVLVSNDYVRQPASFLLYGYSTKAPDDDRPLDTLGRERWTVVKKDGKDVEEWTEAGRTFQRVSFGREDQGVVITKTFTLASGDYHVGLEVRLRRAAGGPPAPLKYRYQLTGGHGLPVEGKWYTSTFRNAMIGQEDDRGYVTRDLQDLRQISVWEGGNEVRKEAHHLIRYAAVAVQYFASVIAVDENQPRQDFVAKVRPTLENVMIKGTVKSVAPDRSSFVLATGEHTEERFQIRGGLLIQTDFRPGARVAVVYHTESHDEKAQAYPHVVTDILDPESSQPLWTDDITVRLSTEPADVKPGGEDVVHKYLLYQGPVKVALLGQMSGEAQVNQDLVNRYLGPLHLDTLTDYQSPGAMGTFSGAIGWSTLIIKCTNLMHWVLGHLHDLIPNYGVCIILLTLLVRSLMFPISRKQALTTMRMQELAPELKKLQEKFKDDRQALAAEQMKLYRKHGVNPFGTCWFLLLQMPIFMGLYFALQESIHFRLAPFWPTWIQNLAAPDMMIWWGQGIPIISRPESYGGMFYLGPFFNLLPVIAVGLMIVQQRLMAPPAVDEQQAMQQKVMTWMMVFIGLMFYKVAAGLCIYFIASSLWGFAERRLLPKKRPAAGEAATAGPAPRTGGEPPAGSTAITSVPATAVQGTFPADRGRGRQQARNRRRPERGVRTDAVREVVLADGGSPIGRFRAWWRQRRERLRDWWTEVLKQAEKK